MKNVSIIIPARNNEKVIGECLESLRRQDYPKKNYEIIVADDHSIDGTVVVAKKYGAKVVKSSNPPGRQRNDAIAAAKGSIIGFIDSDCIAKRNWISEGVKYFDSNEVAVIGGPNLTPRTDSFIAKCIGYVSSSKIATGSMSARYVRDGFGLKEADETSLISCNMFARKDVVERAGCFSTEIFPNEENELMVKIKKMNYRMFYTPNLIVWHHRRSSILGYLKQNLSYGKSRAKLIKMHHSALKPIHPFPSIFVLFLIFGPLLSLASSSFKTLFFITLTLYFSLIILVSIQKGFKEKNIRIAVILPMMFVMLHVSYGAGFLLGLMSK